MTKYHHVKNKQQRNDTKKRKGKQAKSTAAGVGQGLDAELSNVSRKHNCLEKSVKPLICMAIITHQQPCHLQ